jgi:hypothetical protein
MDGVLATTHSHCLLKLSPQLVRPRSPWQTLPVAVSTANSIPQEETIRDLQAALEAKEEELQAARREAAAEADAAVVARMQVRCHAAAPPLSDFVGAEQTRRAGFEATAGWRQRIPSKGPQLPFVPGRPGGPALLPSSPPNSCSSHCPQAREAELGEMLTSAQSSLEAMQKLHTAAQNQLFELQASREEAAVGKQVRRGRWVGGGGVDGRAVAATTAAGCSCRSLVHHLRRQPRDRRALLGTLDAPQARTDRRLLFSRRGFVCELTRSKPAHAALFKPSAGRVGAGGGGGGARPGTHGGAGGGEAQAAAEADGPRPRAGLGRGRGPPLPEIG